MFRVSQVRSTLIGDISTLLGDISSYKYLTWGYKEL